MNIIYILLAVFIISTLFLSLFAIKSVSVIQKLREFK